MGKNAIVTKEETAQAVIEMPAHFANLTGAGFEEMRSEDIAIPFVRILEKGSPQVNKRDGKYVQGAEPGMFFNKGLNAVYDGEKGLSIIPCYYCMRYVEWKPRESGGGFVASHAVKPSGATNVGKEMMLPNGNVLNDTAQFFVLVIGEEGAYPAVLSLKSTQLTKARNWNLAMQFKKWTNPKGEKIPCMFGHTWRMTTVPEANDKGDWFGYKFEHEREIAANEPLFKEAYDFWQSVKAGNVKVKHEDELDSTPSNASPDDNIPF